MDSHGARVVGAAISLLTAQQMALDSAISNPEGRFQFSAVPTGNYLLRVGAGGFQERRVVLNVNQSDIAGMEIVLSPQPVMEKVTVTADPGRVQEASSSSQQVNVISSTQIQERVHSVTAQLANEEVGVALQRTSPTISGIFVRGLTGNKVNVFVDGIRYSTSAMRGGINTFFNLIDHNSLDAVEILRGPASAQYGSDALGGSVQALTVPPALSSGEPVAHNRLSFFGDSASHGFGSNVMTSFGTRHFGLVGSVTGARTNTLAAPAGLDSHSAFFRFFGVPSNVFVGDRLPDTAFTQYGGMLRLNWAPSDNSQFLLHYSRDQQDGGKRHDQLLGGDGNLVADLRNFMLDFFYLKFSQQRLGWLDQLGLSYSYNSQREERVNQGGNGNPLASINHEYERTRVHGGQGYADKQIANNDLLLGAEYYRERITAPSFGVDPVTGANTVRRGRVPDQALYQSGGIYLQDIFQAVPQRLRLVGSVRYSAASYRARAADSPLVGGQPLWPNDSLRVNDWTFRGGIVGKVVPNLTLSANVSRGFRAPHITDLGTLGLTGSGFEVAAPDVAGLGATIGTTADDSAVSTGRPVVQVEPETSLTYEFGVRYDHRRFQTEFSFFLNDINNNITKQALILPQGAVGLIIGGEPIVAQDPSGVVFVDVVSSPVLVRANFDDARLYGFEHTLNWNITPHWSASTVGTYIHAEDERTGLPPNIEGGTPAPDLYLKVRYSSGNGRWWIEPYVHAADRQDRLSTLDLEDRRTGATRSRSNIGNFFNRGATVRGFVDPGPDSTPGTADDFLRATGETLAEIQDRVLGVGVNDAPLYTAVPGYVTFNVRGGISFGERRHHQLIADFQNIGDRNYRGISWGMDAPGRTLALRYLLQF